jgi:hypothetical protein
MADMVILITAPIMVTSLMVTYPMEISAGVDIMVGVVVMAGTAVVMEEADITGTAEGMVGAVEAMVAVGMAGADMVTTNSKMDIDALNYNPEWVAKLPHKWLLNP